MSRIGSEVGQGAQGAVTEAAFRADAAPGAGGGLQDPQVWSSRVAAESLCSTQPRDAAAHHQHPRTSGRHSLLRVLHRPVALGYPSGGGRGGARGGEEGGAR